MKFKYFKYSKFIISLTLIEFESCFKELHMGNNHSHKHKHSHKHNSSDHQHKQCQHNSSKHMDQSSSTQNNKPKSPDQLDMPQFGGQVHIDKIKKVFIKYIKLYEFQYESVQKTIRKRMTLQHPNFITIQNYSYQPIEKHPSLNLQQGLNKLYCCYPSTKVLKLEFEPAILHVNTLIKNYCQERKPIQEQQIRRIVKSVVECLIFLKSNYTYHGDIKPKTIFIHPKTRQVKLIDSFFINNGKSAYQIVNQNPRAESFLTPQQLQKKKTRECDSISSIHQSEVFCLGLTLIEMMTFQSSMQAYNLEMLEIRKDFVQRKLQEMQQYGYSFQLSNLALRCIHKQPSKRPTFQQILRSLN